MLIQGTGGTRTDYDTTYKDGKKNATLAYPQFYKGSMPATVASTNNTSNTSTGTSSGSYGSGSSGSSSNYSYSASDALAAALAAMQQARTQQINAANDALDTQGRASEASYNANRTQVNNDYDKLRGQSEVNRYKSKINQREALANRGALDSGAGRQENLIMSNNYDNALSDIQQNRQAELDKISNAITQLWANIGSQKATNMANGLSDYNSGLYNLISQTYSGYSPENSDYYSAAQNALSKGSSSLAGSVDPTSYGNSAVYDANNSNAYNKLLQAMLGYSY
jgi:hypothetical protein